MTTLKTSTALNLYAGPEALLDYLDPAKQPPTPLVELPPELNPEHREGVRVFAKLLFMTPVFNSKLIAARNLFDEARIDGRLEGVHTLVENSSGNKILADALLARLFGIKNVVAIVPHDIPPDKQALLELFGVKCRKELGGIAKARELGAESGHWNPDQYANQGNPRGFQYLLGRQLMYQTDSQLTVFCAGIGTGGTMLGTSRYLKGRHKVTTIGVIPSTNDVPGVRTKERLKEVDQPWAGAVDALPVVEATDAYYRSLQLCSRGILAGPSSGMALEGLYRHLGCTSHAELNRMRNANGEVVAVVACPDSCLLYLGKYSTRLSAEQMVEAIA
ncbi:MAG: pyridoxal-phosphate dependent enzyme [Patescibacteria group bacterium]